MNFLATSTCFPFLSQILTVITSKSIIILFFFNEVVFLISAIYFTPSAEKFKYRFCIKIPMKTKPLSKIIKEIREANKDPEFRKGVKEFIKFHTGKDVL